MFEASQSFSPDHLFPGGICQKQEEEGKKERIIEHQQYHKKWYL
jgi:hypothetical protein